MDAERSEGKQWIIFPPPAASSDVNSFRLVPATIVEGEEAGDGEGRTWSGSHPGGSRPIGRIPRFANEHVEAHSFHPPFVALTRSWRNPPLLWTWSSSISFFRMLHSSDRVSRWTMWMMRGRRTSYRDRHNFSSSSLPGIKDGSEN